ncbi:hypothetical protein GCM10010123_00510 [Pilimelia anulata]|uniref:Uncharacterized protein n=1 Tax=Pilimelia anulata TaxID=53371 RepID=A0A8J3F5P9_9ACTN|nr:hypothetical protein [Pilimelia anulata]GGJ74387.1 hypothetical protein GCM10010123_00510 [Pilimelia anulata]
MTGVGRLAGLAALAGGGWLLAALTGVDPAADPRYRVAAVALLAVGLFGSTYGIDRADVRGHWRLVLAAVTVGVGLKAALIAGVVVAASGQPAYALLAMAVAQIDPLSVAALARPGRMSPRARSILAAWASFDDPVTTVLTAYGVVLLLPDGPAPSPAGLAGGLLGDAALAAAGWVLWRAGWWLRGRVRAGLAPGGLRRGLLRAGRVLALLLLVGLVAVGVAYGLMLGVAALGFLVRPRFRYGDAVLARATPVAFALATFALGTLLAGGFDPVLGVLLGVAAFAAQVPVALLLARGLPAADRWHLALGQQNGITAVILALLLEPHLPGAAGAIGVAVLTVAVLHAAANHPRWWPTPDPEPPAPAARPGPDGVPTRAERAPG